MVIYRLANVTLNRKTTSMHSIVLCCKQNNWWSCRYNIRGIPGWHWFVIRGFLERSCQLANPLAITKRNDLPTTLCNIHNYINPLNPSTDTILCVLLIMLVASTTAERSLSVVRCMKTYVMSTMKNDRLSSLWLMHIHWDF